MSQPVPGPSPERASEIPTQTTTATATTTTKLRSCVVCRSRKVRCDKLSPCSNCRRANIACVLPSNDRPPRWARRLNRAASSAVAAPAPPQDADPEINQVMDRLRSLEGLVKELSSQLEQAHAAAAATAATSSNVTDSSGVNSPGSSAAYDRDKDHAANTAGVRKQFGRLVLQDANQSLYISGGFWSRVNDELDGLRMNARGLDDGASDTSDEDDSFGRTPSTQELERTPSERHAFLFRHNLGSSAADLREFHPLPSQIPFLLEVYAESLNMVVPIVHIPTVTKMVRSLRGSDMTSLTPANETLLFAIYYTAVTSMEDEDVMANFGSSKADLNLKYRLGLEHALAKADFLNTSDIILVQALAVFLCLARRYDSPRFVWMMTGIVIRMAKALGLHRDGIHFPHLTPFEVEIRRKLWWTLCTLDVRSSEDQGMELTITSGSFDTKLPLNINDADIGPDITEPPQERQGLTDMSMALVFFEICKLKMEIHESRDLEEQARRVKEIYQRVDKGYLQYCSDPNSLTHFPFVVTTRLTMAKMTLIVYLPVLFSSPSDHFSDEIRTKLLVSAIEVAEYNHAFYAEPACRPWRGIHQTYSQWPAIVYMLIEISRRAWSPTVERAWVALHSNWLIPAQSTTNKNARIWIPLRKLMTKARRHREAELKRLQADPQAAEKVEMEDRKIALPESHGPFPGGESGEQFRELWRKLVTMPRNPDDGGIAQSRATDFKGTAPATAASVVSPATNPVKQSPGSVHGYGDMWPGADLHHTRDGLSHPIMDPNHPTTIPNPSSVDEVGLGHMPGLLYTFPTVPAEWTGSQNTNGNVLPWLWADADASVDAFADVDVDVDINMDLEGEVDWYNWMESAKGM